MAAGPAGLPVQSLGAVEDAAWSASPGEWHLSAIAGPDARAALARVDAFNARWAGRARIASVEFCACAAGRHRRLDESRRRWDRGILRDADRCRPPARLDAIRCAAPPRKSGPAASRRRPFRARRRCAFSVECADADSPSRPRPACITPCEAATLSRMSAAARRR